MTTQSAAVIAPPEEEEVTTAEIDVKKLLDALVPPVSIEIVDIFGNEYKLPTACSARSQIKILNELEQLKAIPAVASLFTGFQVADVTDVVSIIVSVAGDPAVMAGIATCFELAHPKAYARARIAADEAGTEYADAADLFPVEELAGAVVPLFIRLIRRGANAIQTLGKATDLAPSMI